MVGKLILGFLCFVLSLILMNASVMVMVKLLLTGFVTASGLFYLRTYIKGRMCPIADRIDGKHVLITGANTGIGLETAVELARRGGIIHMACRDSKKCEWAKETVILRSHVSRDKVFAHNLDLASIKSILSFTKQFKSSVDKLDILINNAGIMMCPYMETEDGFEMQIGVNHLGHFLLTNELLDLIKKTKESRIIIVSSRAHIRGHINTDINLRGDSYGRGVAYSQSKLANILHAKYLAKLLKNDGISVVSLHPGVIHTELGRHIPYSDFLEKYLGFLFDFFLRTPLEGAQTTIFCAVNPQLHKYSGEYFSDCQPVTSKNSETTNEALMKSLWKKSTELINEKLVGLK